jgi:steroid 5-alpha reductase family enzyme
MTPLFVVISIAAGVSAFTLVASLITKTTSWVDQLWSIVPVVYVWVFAISTGLGDARLVIMAVLVTLWGARLTFNFARKGGYAGEEDYRWAVLRKRMTPAKFQLFNVFFIVLFQNALLVLITLPALTAWEHRGTPLRPLDFVVTAVFLLLLAGEAIADQQQWNFQQLKKAGKAEGFVTSGLWRYSRHPNFFFEQAQWWVFFLFGAIAAGSILQWTVAGAFVLTVLFVGSTIFTESITRSKYPAYADYQAVTSPVVPWFPLRRRASTATA